MGTARRTIVSKSAHATNRRTNPFRAMARPVRSRPAPLPYAGVIEDIEDLSLKVEELLRRVAR
jgi:hypothetical protein